METPNCSEDPELPEPSPELQLMLDQVDALFDGLDEQGKHEVGKSFYIDGDNRPRTRHGLLRAVND